MGSMISKLLFQPPTPPTYSATPNFFYLYTARQQKISAFFIDRNAPVTLLFSHGNAEDLGMVYDWFREVSRELYVNVLAYDYTGYGLNSGQCSEADCFADIEAAFNYATDVLSIPPNRIVLYGRSLGSGPSCHLARAQSMKGAPLCGMILQSPLMSAYRVAFHFRFTMPGDMFANIDKIPDVRCPVFILHGTRDEVVPYWHGQELYLALSEAFRYQPFWVDGAGHNNIEMLCRNDHSFFLRLGEFLDFLVPDRNNEESMLDFLSGKRRGTSGKRNKLITARA